MKENKLWSRPKLSLKNEKSMHRKETSFHSPPGHFVKPCDFQLTISKPPGAQGTRDKVQVLPWCKGNCFLPWALSADEAMGDQDSMQQYLPWYSQK